jgi:hypothetical protein
MAIEAEEQKDIGGAEERRRIEIYHTEIFYSIKTESPSIRSFLFVVWIVVNYLKNTPWG